MTIFSEESTFYGKSRSRITCGATVNLFLEINIAVGFLEMEMSVCRQARYFGPDWNISTPAGWIVSQRMNPTNLGGPLTFHVGQSFHLSSEISQHLLDELAQNQTKYLNDSGDPLTFVVLNEMSQQLLDGLSWNFVQTFRFPWGWIVTLTFHLASGQNCKRLCLLLISMAITS